MQRSIQARNAAVLSQCAAQNRGQTITMQGLELNDMLCQHTARYRRRQHCKPETYLHTMWCNVVAQCSVIVLHHTPLQRTKHNIDEVMQATGLTAIAHLASRVHSQGNKLHRVGRCHGSEVPVPDQVKCSHCAIQTGADHHAATGQESHCSDWGSVL